MAFCAHAIHSDDLFCVTNAKDDDRFHDNPLVSGGPNIRFYAGVPLVTSDGFRLGTLCAIDDKARDISEDHRQLLIDLANLVVDELELKKTRRELSEEIALRDRFFSIIAHDLKSPLSSLLGLSHFLSVMSEKLTKEKMAEIAGNVHMSGMRVLALVENLLEWAQLQTEKDQVSPEIIPVSSLLDECLGLIQNLAHQKKIQLSAKECDAHIYADKNMTFTVIRNLLSNAVKFTPPGGYVEISAEDLGGSVKFVVADTGEGIPSSVQDDLFKVDVKTTTIGTAGETGTGLGLPVCRQMVELNGGRIGFNAREPNGTAFFFTLPAPD